MPADLHPDDLARLVFEDAGGGALHLEDRSCRRSAAISTTTDAAASEGLDGPVARAKLYMEAGADAIFPEALNTAEMFRAFAQRMPGVPLLANMTEFGGRRSSPPPSSRRWVMRW